MSINVGFDDQGQLMTTDGAALTVWGKTIMHHSHDHVHDIDLSVFPVVDDFILWVEIGIVANDYQLVDVDQWADYVFDEGYHLTPLDEVDRFVKKNHHLRGIPSTQELDRKVYTVKEMNRDFMARIEELTLYVLNQHEELMLLQTAANEMPPYEDLLRDLDHLEKQISLKIK